MLTHVVARGGEVLPRVVPALGADTPRGPGALTCRAATREMAPPEYGRGRDVREIITAVTAAWSQLSTRHQRRFSSRR
jgi:hypothetical protein